MTRRLGIATDAGGWGGAESCLEAIVAGLEGQLDALVIFAVEATVAARLTAAVPPGITVTAVALAARSSPLDLRPVLAWARALRRHPVDLLHVNATFTFGNLPACAAARLTGTPYLIQEHLPLPPSRPRVQRPVKRLLAAGAVAQIAVGEQAARDTEGHLGLARGEVRVIPNGIEVGDLPAGKRAGIVAVGRLTHHKGFDLLVEALAGLPGTTATIVGDGPELGALQKQAAELGVADRLSFAGARADARALMAAAVVVVIPSRHESGPLVLLEALAVGTPVVMTRVGLAQEVLGAAGPDRRGDIVPVQDAGALRRSLAGVLAAPEAARRRAGHGQALVRERYTVTAMQASWRAEYDAWLPPAEPTAGNPARQEDEVRRSWLVGRRWLVVAEEDLLPTTTGGRVDADALLSALRHAGAEVLLMVPGRAVDPAAYELRYPGMSLCHLPRNFSPLGHLGLTPYVVASRPPLAAADQAVADFAPEVVIVLSIRSAELGLRWHRRTGAPLIVRRTNLESAYFANLASAGSGIRSLAHRIESWRMNHFEHRLDRGSEVAVFADISATEAAAHRAGTTSAVVHLPTMLRELQPHAHGQVRESHSVVFTGSLDVELNIEAARWLIREVWPLVLAGSPGALLRIVGRAPGAALQTAIAAAPGVSLHADVPEVASFLAVAAVAVNPVQRGAGINIKLVQSVAAGCASVTTSVGADGLDWRDGRELMVADGPVAFAAAVVRLLTDAALRSRISQDGAAWAAHRLDPLPILTELAGALDRA